MRKNITEIGEPKVDVKVSVDGGKEFAPKSYIMLFVNKTERTQEGLEVFMIKVCELPNSTSVQEVGTYIAALNDVSSDLSSEMAERFAIMLEDMEKKNAS